VRSTPARTAYSKPWQQPRNSGATKGNQTKPVAAEDKASGGTKPKPTEAGKENKEVPNNNKSRTTKGSVAAASGNNKTNKTKEGPLSPDPVEPSSQEQSSKSEGDNEDPGAAPAEEEAPPKDPFEGYDKDLVASIERDILDASPQVRWDNIAGMLPIFHWE